jgi:predicted house-cleaning noncanonical NTP pyrophosphatase (MazG superfamily)
MRLPIIKHTLGFIQDNDADYILETMEVLEHLADARGIKDEELEVIGELISNLAGALEVHAEIKSGVAEKEALNAFMKRVQGAID